MEAFLASVFAFLVIWFGIGKIKKALQASHARQAKLERPDLHDIQIRSQKEDQERLLQQFVSVGTTSLGLFDAMTAHLLCTEELLDQAERDFKEGVFAPFWDSIEKAMLRFSHFDECVREITINSKKHTALAKIYKSSPPQFPIDMESVDGMSAANSVSDHFKSIVRKAQSNPHFAMIYEQRRTNQLLVAGFSNLAQALDGMGQRISSSIDGLGSQISEMTSTLDNSLTRLGNHIQTATQDLQTAQQELIENVDNFHSTANKEASDQAERHKQALVMLDNIQRRRVPYR